MTSPLSPQWMRLLYREARKVRPELPDLDPHGQASQIAAKLAPAVMRLSEGLTRARKLAGTQYLNEREAALAYLLYYLPVNAARTRYALDRLPPGFFDREGGISVLDLGSGPGTQLLALLNYLSETRGGSETPGRAGQGTPLRLTYRAVDHSGKALTQLQQLAEAARRDGLIPAGVHLTVETTRGALLPASGLKPAFTLPQGGVSLVMMGYALNELQAGQVTAEHALGFLEVVLGSLTAGGAVLLVEPALQETALRLQQVRDGLVQRGLMPISPCTHANACPLAAPQRPARQWCHEELRWERPPLIEALDRLTGLDKERAAFSHLLMLQNDASSVTGSPQNVAGLMLQAQAIAKPVNPETHTLPPMRVMSPPLSANGTQSIYLCGADGFSEAMRLNRHKSVDNGAFDDLHRGDIVQLSNVGEKGGKWRVESDTLVDVLIEA